MIKLDFIRSWMRKRFNQVPDLNQSQSKDYYTRAQSWVEDRYLNLYQSRMRYQWAFLGMGLIVGLLLLCLVLLIPLQKIAVVVVHQGPSGYVWLSELNHVLPHPISWRQTQSEIAAYIVARESYDPIFYAQQAGQVRSMSSSSVMAHYLLSEDHKNKLSPIHLLGARGYRTCEVESIIPLSSDLNRSGRHFRNMAQVQFVIKDHLFGQEQVVTSSYKAMVSWRYRGLPNNPQQMLSNWDGFEITHYWVTPMAIDKTNQKESVS